MTKSSKNSSLYIFLIIFSFILTGCSQSNAFIQSGIPFACSNPDYKDIENGMTQEEVRKLLDMATTVYTRENDPGNSLFEYDPNKEEYWFYKLNPKYWQGNLEVYFDKEEKVIGKNCGWV